MAQFARPAADLTVGSWTTNGGSGSNLFAAIDETSADDADYVQCALAGNDAYEVRLSTVLAPLIARGHVLRYRGAKGTAGGNTRGVTVELRQGATVIASNSHPDLTAIWLDGAIALTKAQGAAITDYSDLRVRFTATGSTAGPAGNRRRVQIGWCQLRVPDWQPTYDNDWGADEDTSVPGVWTYTLDGFTGSGSRREDALVDLWQKRLESEGESQSPVTLRRRRMAYYSRKTVDYTDLRARILAGTYTLPPHQTQQDGLDICDAKLGRFAVITVAADAEDRA